LLLLACGSGDGTGGSGGTAGSGGACAASFAGCTAYEDHTAAADSRNIAFVTAMYTPSCMKIKAGQTVTFSGQFAAHPLMQSCGPAPAVITNGTGTSKSITFAAAGDYGYYCTVHGTASGFGMAGSISVVP
jgi:plastocyanin